MIEFRPWLSVSLLASLWIITSVVTPHSARISMPDLHNTDTGLRLADIASRILRYIWTVVVVKQLFLGLMIMVVVISASMSFSWTFLVVTVEHYYMRYKHPNNHNHNPFPELWPESNLTITQILDRIGDDYNCRQGGTRTYVRPIATGSQSLPVLPIVPMRVAVRESPHDLTGPWLVEPTFELLRLPAPVKICTDCRLPTPDIRISLGRVYSDPALPLSVLAADLPPLGPNRQTFNFITHMFNRFGWLQVATDAYWRNSANKDRYLQRVRRYHIRERNVGAPAVGPIIPLEGQLALRALHDWVDKPVILRDYQKPYAHHGLLIDDETQFADSPNVSPRQRRYYPIRYVCPSTLPPQVLAMIAPVAITSDLPIVPDTATEQKYVAVAHAADFGVLRLEQLGGYECLSAPERASIQISTQWLRTAGTQAFAQASRQLSHRENIFGRADSAAPTVPEPLAPGGTYELERVYRHGARVIAYKKGYCPHYNWGNHMLPGGCGLLDPSQYTRQAVTRNCKHIPYYTQDMQRIIGPITVPAIAGELRVLPLHGHAYHNQTPIRAHSRIRGTLSDRLLYIDDGNQLVLKRTITAISRYFSTMDRAEELFDWHLDLVEGDVLFELSAILGSNHPLAKSIKQLGNILRGNVRPYCTLIGVVHPPRVIPIRFAHLDKAPGLCKLLYGYFDWTSGEVADSPLNAAHLRQLNYKRYNGSAGSRRLLQALRQLHGAPTFNHPNSAMEEGVAMMLAKYQITLAVSNMTPPEIMPRFPTDIEGTVPSFVDYYRYLAKKNLTNAAAFRRENLNIKPPGSQFFNTFNDVKGYETLIRTKVIRRADRSYTSDGALLTFSVPLSMIPAEVQPVITQLLNISQQGQDAMNRYTVYRRNHPDSPLILQCAIPITASMYVIPFEAMTPQGVLLPTNTGTPEDRARVEYDRVYTAGIAQRTVDAARVATPGATAPCAAAASTAGVTTWRSDLPHDVVTGQVPGTLLMHSGLMRIYEEANVTARHRRLPITPANVATQLTGTEPVITPDSCRTALNNLRKLRYSQSKIIEPTWPVPADAPRAFSFAALHGSVKVIDMAATTTRLNVVVNDLEGDTFMRNVVQDQHPDYTEAQVGEYMKTFVSIIRTALMEPNSPLYDQVVSSARISIPLCIMRQPDAEDPGDRLVLRQLDETHTVFRQGCLVGPGGLKRLITRYDDAGATPTRQVRESAESVCSTNPLVFTGPIAMTLQRTPIID